MERIEKECNCEVQNLPHVGVFILTYSSSSHKFESKLSLRASKQIGTDDVVIGIVQNLDSRKLPLDPNFLDLQWALYNIPNGAGINIRAGWDEYLSDEYCGGSSRSDVVVAVIDTGVDYNHPELNDMMWRNSNEVPDNGIDDDGNGIIDDIYGADFTQTPPSGDPMEFTFLPHKPQVF